MKTKTKTAITFLAGLLFGLAIAAIPLWQSARLFKQNYINSLLDQTNVAYMIAAGRSEELLKNIERQLPQYLLTLEHIWGQDDQTLQAYWFIQKFYKDNAISVPNDIAPILAAIPPRPPKSCELQKTGRITKDNDPNNPQQNK